MEKWERKKERVNQRVTAAADAVVGWQGGKVLVEGRGKKRRRKRQKRQKLRGQELKGKERKEQVVVVVVRLMVMAMVMATANHWSTGRFRTVDMGRGGRQTAEMEEDCCCCCCCCCFCHRFPNHCHWASETRRHRWRPAIDKKWERKKITDCVYNSKLPPLLPSFSYFHNRI